MEENKLKELLERYWCAETTLEEEKLIEEYIVSNGTECAYEDIFLNKNAARKIFIPATEIGRWSEIRKTHRYTHAWIRQIAAIFIVAIVTVAAVLLVKQKAEQSSQMAAQTQLEADLTLMFNAVNDSYNDITSYANHLNK